ncbi:hypothetical protein NDU88_007849 [Pleurodeles waltl]|uniref:Uncharacterized protein n=1 Tax=Pleurodeles waltl TaxID=8319 RepID=A0AAV7VUN2_PLEWA|nr:hypothetical protein NDU88_007849 [Pleurodeles waltl]
MEHVASCRPCGRGTNPVSLQRSGGLRSKFSCREERNAARAPLAMWYGSQQQRQASAISTSVSSLKPRPPVAHYLLYSYHVTLGSQHICKRRGVSGQTPLAPYNIMVVFAT